jgi:hypothetical protein
MCYVVAHYTEARGKARKAAERIRHRYTWPKAAQRLVQIIREST